MATGISYQPPKKEVCNFVETVLGISNLQEKLQGNKLDLLNEIIPPMFTIPFHNVDLLKTRLEDLRIPDLEENCKLVFSKRGGRCYGMNTVIWAVVKALGNFC